MDQYFSGEIAQRLNHFAETLGEKYRSAKPFPHIVIDDLLPAPVLDRVLDAFPDPETFKWMRWDSKHEQKLAFFEAERLSPPLREILHFFNSATALRFLEQLTGIKGLLPDPYFYGGGLHEIRPGGFLEVHADFNRQHELNVERRLNLLLYLNKDWEEEYGGHLELWETDMSRCAEKILPIFNRCVIFNTTGNSYHGHPHPLTCPEGRSRKSVALYYYTATLEPQAPLHSTLFQERPPEPTATRRIKQTLKPFVPPIAVDAWRKLKRGTK